MRTHLDLCSGIGGFSLAASWHGMRTVGFCDIDPFAQRVLAKHWPGTPIHDDLRTLTADVVRGWLGGAGTATVADAERLRRDRHGGEPNASTAQGTRGSVAGGEPQAWRIASATRDSGADALDLLTAGYPCQPFSHAGQRLGAADDRHLWPAIAGLLGALRPRWCLFENVVGHVSLGLDDVLADLEDLGYAWGAAVVPACAVNAPHRRDRVWIVALSDAERRDGRAHDEGQGSPDRNGTQAGGAPPADAGEGGRGAGQHHILPGQPDAEGRGALADAARERVNRSGRTRHGRAESPDDCATNASERDAVSGSDDAGCTDWRDVDRRTRRDVHGASPDEALSCLGLQNDGLPRRLVDARLMDPRWQGNPRAAFGPDWEGGVPRVTDHEPDRVSKLMALGNAVVPQVAYVILGAMIAADREAA